MVKIRLQRVGAHKAPKYRIVAADSHTKRDGKYIELVGTYNPIEDVTKVDEEVALKWLNVGAEPTDTVRSIFSKQGIMKKFAESKKSGK